MQIRKFRAADMQQALAIVRDELGDDAAVLHTREVRAGGLLRPWSRREIEVTASRGVHIPSRLPPELLTRRMTAPLREDNGLDLSSLAVPQPQETSPPPVTAPAAAEVTVVESRPSPLASGRVDYKTGERHQMPEAKAVDPHVEVKKQLEAELGAIDIQQDLAGQIIDRVARQSKRSGDGDITHWRTAAMADIARRIRTTGPIASRPGQQRLAALVGPTGVGKTTTIAKLAANLRLREKRRVGLITVDTYRIAAVDQLRTYADIIDLPMEVVGTPREMRAALDRLSEMDVILMDTAGRSPRDEVKIQELKLILNEAEPHEVHLVLSSVAGGKHLGRAIEKFRSVGLSSILFTKLDEAAALGHLLSVVENAQLPLSYLTDGQDVPDDIEPAEAERFAQRMLANSEFGPVDVTGRNSESAAGR